MAEIVNLRHARKQQARADAASKASANRAKFGEAKARTRARKAELTRADAEHAGKKRED